MIVITKRSEESFFEIVEKILEMSVFSCIYFFLMFSFILRAN